MLPSQKNKATISILEKLRQSGAPAISPFPGEQEEEMEGQDLDLMGSLTSGVPEELRRKKLMQKKALPLAESEE